MVKAENLDGLLEIKVTNPACELYKEYLVDLKSDFAKSIIAAKKLLENPELRNLTEEEVRELENGSTKLSNMSKAEEFITARTRNYINTAQEWDNGNSTLILYPWIAPDDARIAVEIAREEMIKKACEYLDLHCDEVKTEDNGIAGWIDNEFIDNFRKAMKDE